MKDLRDLKDLTIHQTELNLIERGTPFRRFKCHSSEPFLWALSIAAIVRSSAKTKAPTLWVEGLRFLVQGLGFGVQGSGFGVQGSGPTVHGHLPHKKQTPPSGPPKNPRHILSVGS